MPTHPSDKNKDVRWMGHSFIPPWVGFAGGGLIRDKFVSRWEMSKGSQVHADPPIGQKQRRPMDGAQFHSRWVGFAGGGLLLQDSVRR
jgi:hypothetical protein